MCSCAKSNPDNPDLPPWLLIGVNWGWKRRDSIRRVAVMCALAAAIVGILVYRFSPTDLERADADIKKARVVIISLDEEANQQLEDAARHRKRAAELRKTLEEKKGSPDTAMVEWCEAMLHSHTQMQKAKDHRRDNLVRLTAQSMRLLAEAECEILRAKDARDRGTPYVVAPRVQELLAPVVAAR